jgi:DNA-nicking Smr family endonuclease
MSFYADKNNKYKQVPDLVLDLHGYTTLECEDSLEEIYRSKIYKHVRLIVGKGRNSENGPVLPNFVKNYLSGRNIRFNQSKIEDGGEGSLEVFF